MLGGKGPAAEGRRDFCPDSRVLHACDATSFGLRRSDSDPTWKRRGKRGVIWQRPGAIDLPPREPTARNRMEDL